LYTCMYQRCRRITFGRRAFSVAGPTELTYRPSFVVCPSVLVTFDARLRRYHSGDISALSALDELHNDNIAL